MDQDDLDHLKKLSITTASICPALSSFYRYKIKSQQDTCQYNDEKCERYHACPFCNTPFTLGNHRVRLVPKMKLDKRMKKLLRKNECSSQSLGKFQNMLVKNYRKSCNKLVVTCFACKKITKLPGQSRKDKAIQKQTEIKIDIPVAELKSRKQKLKQKKKDKRKLRKLGLSAKEGHGITVNRSDLINFQSLTSKENSERSLSVSSETPTVQVRTVLNNERSLLHSTLNSDVREQTLHGSLPQSVRSLQKQSIHTQLRDFRPVQNIGSKGAIQSKKMKTKAKDLHQQLGKILKKEAKRMSGVGSLTDFLSSL
ncbi:hypothetical protein CHS0354_030152 [Potamilus streckersoni]|uniref:Uncharacterized protein n=1 Tax=Potamilus streckersoni TaxID=2493646 RepID=A0AAE0ST32_9BIVA|nr:hypothetical protein CHS0354_030152 [Potamilus streckersoni]